MFKFNFRNIDFLRYHKALLLVSAVSLLGCFIVFLVIGFNTGIDFSGGVIVTLKPNESEKSEVSKQKIEEVLGYNVGVTFRNDGMVEVKKYVDVKSEEHDSKVLADSLILKGFKVDSLEYISGQISGELLKKGLFAVILSVFAILVYISLRFEWQYGLGVVAALMHDLLFVIGFIAVTRVEFNISSIAAVLTVLGYSVSDSVIIYERIKEEIYKQKSASLYEIIKVSLNHTISRTMMTSVITLLAILAVMVVGGQTVRGFAMITFFGIAMGTYSSIFISAAVLLYVKPSRFKVVKEKGVVTK